MSNILRNMSLAVALMVLSAPMLGTDVQAKDSFMKACSTKWNAAKAAGTPEGKMKWTDFMKSQCAADTAAAPAPAAPAATPVKTMAKPAAPAAAATPAATPSGSFMKDCGAAWKGMKAANSVPAGMKFNDFVKAGCKPGATAAATPPAAAAPATKPAMTAPVKPAVAVAPVEPAGAADTADLKTVDKNGKPFTPAQMAAHQRARDCGNQWRTAKASNQLAPDMKWPQYWHECSMRMKAAGK